MSQYGPPGGGYPPQQPGGYPGQPGGYPSQGGYPGQPAGYGAAPGGYPGGMGGTPQLAGWGARFGAYFIDGLIQGAPIAIGGIVYAIAAAMSIDTSTGEVGGGFYVGICFMVVGGLASLVLGIMNRWVKGGKTGQTWGRKFLGIKLVGEQTGQPIGAGSAFVRDLCHMLDAAPCYIGFLAPLWDDRNQTWADKIMKTLVVKA